MGYSKILWRTFTGIIICVMIPLLALRKSDVDDQAIAKASERLRVGFSMSEIVNPWRTVQINSFRESLAGAGYEFVYTEPAEHTFGWQYKNICEMLESGIDYLFIVPAGLESYLPVARLAREYGTRVISVGQPLNGCVIGEDYLSCIYYDYYQAGRLCSQMLVENRVGENINILEIKSSNESLSSEISKGFLDGLGNSGTYNIIADIEADGNRILTQRLLEKTLIEANNNRIEFDAIFSHNDEDGLGALNALKLAGYDVSGIHSVSINGEQDVLKAIIAEEYLATVSCSPQTGLIANHIISLSENGHRAPKSILLPCLLINSENALVSYDQAY